MKRILLALAMATAAYVPAAMAATILSLPITTAVTAQVSPTFQLRAASVGGPRSMTVQFNFTYGSGGTSADAYLQTSLDGGATWNDVANFHATTASLRKMVNLSSATPVISPFATGTDGSLSANTAVDGILGSMWRVKYTTVGTYAASTTLNVDVQSSVGLTPR